MYPQSLDRINDPQVKTFILQCIDFNRNRPTAHELLNSDFMLDKTSVNNEHPCALLTVLPKSVKPDSNPKQSQATAATASFNTSNAPS